MRALVVYGSPRGKNSASYRLGSKFSNGLKENGWQVDEVILSEVDIKHCAGCYTCWTKTPGRCIHRDGMEEVLKKYEGLNLLFIATPLYYFNVPGKMKDYFDRQLPLVTPYLVKMGDTTSHDARGSFDGLKVIVLSVCGFPEKSHFDALSFNMKKVYGDILANELYVPGAEAIAHDTDETAYKDLYEVLHKAGAEYSKNKAISPGTVAEFERITTFTKEQKEAFINAANLWWAANQPKTVEAGAKEVSLGRELKVSDGGLASYFAGMASTFNGTVYQDTNATIVFNLDGKQFTLLIKDGECKAYEGAVEGPSMTFISPESVWMGLSSGKLDGQKGFMEGLYKIEGDMSYLLEMGKMFGQT